MRKRFCSLKQWRTGLVLAAAWILMVTPASSVAGVTVDDHIITDSAGRRLEITRPFHRIISLYAAHTENLFHLGADDDIIGVSPHDTYPPDALKKPVFSYREDPEKFLAARPDLVLVRPMIDRGHPNLIHRLEKSGIRVVSLQPGTLQEMYVYWQVLGMLTGREEHARQMIARFRDAVARCRSATSALAKRKRVYFEAIHTKMKTFSPGAMAIFALETAGGINAAADAQPVHGTNIAWYGKERLLSHAEDIDVYLAQKGQMNPVTVSMIRAEPGYQALPAIRDGRVYLIDESLVSRPTPRLLLGISAIGQILYPDIFTNELKTELDALIP